MKVECGCNKVSFPDDWTSDCKTPEHPKIIEILAAVHFLQQEVASLRLSLAANAEFRWAALRVLQVALESDKPVPFTMDERWEQFKEGGRWP